MAKWFGRRTFNISLRQPLISFTFDDFPRSAFFTAGSILEQHGVAGSYYTAFGLANQIGPTGEIFHPDDLHPLLARGHEIGCHTFDHLPAWETAPTTYDGSVARNAVALSEFALEAKFVTHSYPISYPRPGTKRRLAHRFHACRGGGQTINQGMVDLNYLNSFFLEQSRDDLDAVERIISRNAVERGWLVFSTHDVCNRPTRFGCNPSFFEKVVQCSVKSGANILLMSAALNNLHAGKCAK
jgi:peptidoglycan/xylan/chitin deacetylase (PgdA/CDA1 family)